MSLPLLEHLPLIAEKLAAAAHLLLGLDYDGSLTPIVDDPANAWLHTDVRETLRCLSQRPATTVAVISGRAMNDVRVRVGLATLVYAGNHGLEIHGPVLRFAEVTAHRNRDYLKLMSRELVASLAAIPGVAVEDKGLTLSVHFRHVAPTRQNDVRQIVEATIGDNADRFWLRIGKCVFEVLPRVEWNKGKAIGLIRAHVGKSGTLVIYLGDDFSDEDAFCALRQHITVKVGDPSRSAANYYVAGPDDVKTFLVWLARVRRIEAQP